MDDIVRTLAAMGLPGVILVITMAATGLSGAAAITAALAFLGGPAGMLGGIAVLGVTGLIAQALSTVGIYTLLCGVYAARAQSESKVSLLREIDCLPTVDINLKLQLKEVIHQNSP